MNVERTRRIQFEKAGAETEKDKAMGGKKTLDYWVPRKISKRVST